MASWTHTLRDGLDQTATLAWQNEPYTGEKQLVLTTHEPFLNGNDPVTDADGNVLYNEYTQVLLNPGMRGGVVPGTNVAGGNNGVVAQSSLQQAADAWAASHPATGSGNTDNNGSEAATGDNQGAGSSSSSEPVLPPAHPEPEAFLELPGGIAAEGVDYAPTPVILSNDHFANPFFDNPFYDNWKYDPANDQHADFFIDPTDRKWVTYPSPEAYMALPKDSVRGYEWTQSYRPAEDGTTYPVWHYRNYVEGVKIPILNADLGFFEMKELPIWDHLPTKDEAEYWLNVVKTYEEAVLNGKLLQDRNRQRSFEIMNPRKEPVDTTTTTSTTTPETQPRASEQAMTPRIIRKEPFLINLIQDWRTIAATTGMAGLAALNFAVSRRNASANGWGDTIGPDDNPPNSPGRVRSWLNSFRAGESRTIREVLNPDHAKKKALLIRNPYVASVDAYYRDIAAILSGSVNLSDEDVVRILNNRACLNEGLAANDEVISEDHPHALTADQVEKLLLRERAFITELIKIETGKDRVTRKEGLPALEHALEECRKIAPSLQLGILDPVFDVREYTGMSETREFAKVIQFPVRSEAAEPPPYLTSLPVQEAYGGD